MKQFSAIAQTFILTSFSAFSLLAVPAQAASFIGLGNSIVHNPFDNPDDNRNYYNSTATDISADGSVVVGAIDGDWGYPGNIAGYSFRWTQADGMNIIATGSSSNPYRPPSSSANGVSADGSVVVGWSFNRGYRVGMDSFSAFRWTLDLGQVNFPDINANDVSANGSVMVGSILGVNFFNPYDPYPKPPYPPYDPDKAYRWTQETGLVELGNIGNNSSDSVANGVSADGSVVVGSSRSAGGYEVIGYDEAFRWTQEAGMVGLGSLAGNSDSNSGANAVSANGSVIVGGSDSNSGFQAFRWTQETGMVGLGSLTSNGGSSANDVSSDGSIVVGQSGGQAFRWSQSDGMVSLKDTLIGAGLDVSGWSLTSANAISADGFTLVGNGINPSGQTEAWVANLEPIPEPLTILGSIAAIAFAAGFERKFSKNKSEEKDPDA
jgi:probable HAF family extracellular repeat protein